MTILPKKKPPQQGSGSGEVEGSETASSTTHQHQMPMGSLPNHIQAGEGTSRGTLYLSSQSPPPCWPPPPPTSTPREEKRSSHASPSHFEDAHESGPSHSKRRYRASPLRYDRGKIGVGHNWLHVSLGNTLLQQFSVRYHGLNSLGI